MNAKHFSFTYALTPKVDFNFINHVHPNHELLYIINGSGRFLIEDVEYAFSENSVFLIPYGKYHVMSFPPHVDYERVVIHFEPELLSPFIDKHSFFHFVANKHVQDLIKTMLKYEQKFKSELLEEMFPSMINQILINLVYDRENGFEEPEQKNVPTLIKNALKYINENLDKPLTTHGIAKALFVSKDHLCHAFSKTLNTGIMQFVSIKRAYKARSMIKSGIPAVTVSEKLGYAYYSTFLRNYKSHFGITPSEEKVDG